MKKVAIVTLIGYFNYGNRLQNYATQETIRGLGYDVETIIYNRALDRPKESSHQILIRKFVTFRKLLQKGDYEPIKKKLTNRLYKSMIQERDRSFRLFTQSYIHETDFRITDQYIPNNLSERYDFFVTGSDQVWNPAFAGSPIYFLTFAPAYKRIAYAASFGVSNLPENCLENYRKWISEIPYLSVREQAGADIIKELTGRDAVVLVDPTLMLSKSKWLSISKSGAHKPSKPYLLTYFLGPIADDVKHKIKDVAFRKKLEVVHLASFGDKRRYTADPAEFLDYINSAEIVFTDSFHGTVFSMLFEKPFVVCDRISSIAMHSRIDTILSKFKLESRRWQNIKTQQEGHFFEADFSHVPPILELERKKAIDFLKVALSESR